MLQKYTKQANEFVDACHRIAKLGFVASHGGNLSWRIDDNVILISPTKVYKGDISIEDVVFINLEGKVLYASNNRKPTGEAPFHTRILQKRRDLVALVHAHPPEVTGMAISHSNLLSRPLLPEPIIEVGPVIPVDYKEPLSNELALAFDAVMEKSNAFLMHNHGILLGSVENITRAIELLELIETTAKSARIAMSLGQVHEISKVELLQLENTIVSRGLSLPGAPGANKSLSEIYFPL